MSIEVEDANTLFLDTFSAYKELVDISEWELDEKTAALDCLWVMEKVTGSLPLKSKKNDLLRAFGKVDIVRQLYKADVSNDDSIIKPDVGAFLAISASSEAEVLEGKLAQNNSRLLRLMGLQVVCEPGGSPESLELSGSIVVMNDDFSQVNAEQKIVEWKVEREEGEATAAFAARAKAAISEKFETNFIIIFFWNNFTSSALMDLNEGRVDYTNFDNKKLLMSKTDPRIIDILDHYGIANFLNGKEKD